MRRAVIVGVVLACVALALGVVGARQLGTDVDAVHDVHDVLSTVATDFDAHADEVRVVVLVSPT